MPVQPALRAEWKRRMRFLNASLAGERPKGDPKSYVRLRLINILPDGSYQVTPKGRMYAKPEYHGDMLNDPEPEPAPADQRILPRTSWPY